MVRESVEGILFLADSYVVVDLALANQSDLVKMQIRNQADRTVILDECQSLDLLAIVDATIGADLGILQPRPLIDVVLADLSGLVKHLCQVEITEADLVACCRLVRQKVSVLHVSDEEGGPVDLGDDFDVSLIEDAIHVFLHSVAVVFRKNQQVLSRDYSCLNVELFRICIAPELASEAVADLTIKLRLQLRPWVQLKLVEPCQEERGLFRVLYLLLELPRGDSLQRGLLFQGLSFGLGAFLAPASAASNGEKVKPSIPLLVV